MKNGFSKNIFFSVLSQVIFYATPLILAPYLSRVLGPSAIGEYSYCVSYSYYFASVIALGFGTLGIKMISSKSDSKDEYSKIFWSIMISKLAIGLIVIIIYILLVGFSAFGPSPNYIIMLILVISLVANIIDTRFLFQGLGNFKIISTLQIIINTLYAISVFLFIKNVNNLLLYSILKSSIDFIINIILIFFCYKKVGFICFSKNIIMEIIKKSTIIFVPSILINCGTQLDQTFLGFFANDYQVGIYQQAVKFPLLIGNFTYAIAPVALSFTSSLNINTDGDLIKNKLSRILIFAFFISAPCCFGLISISKIFVPLYFGNEFLDVVNLVYILSFMVLFSPLSSILINSYFYPFDKIRNILLISISQIVLNCSLNFIFIYFLKMGAIGASTATLICEFYLLASLTIFARKFLDFKKIIWCISKILLACISMISLITIINYYAENNINSIALVFIDICVGSLIYAVLLFLFKEENLLFLITKVKSIIKK